VARGTNFKKFNSENREITLLQANVEAALTALISTGLLNGALLTDIELSSGANTVEHKLGRKIQGRLIVAQSAAADLSDNISSSDNLEQNFVLTSSAACTVSLWVF
jgi:myo-inositol-hexaphosphate 3-phosphohydrolase